MKHEELKVANQENLNEAYCPLPLSVIPNHMGINLCSVESVSWVKQDDGQLVSFIIKFAPYPKETDNAAHIDFGQALEALRLGGKATRSGWGEKGLWLSIDNDRTEDDITLPFVVLNYPGGNVPSHKPGCTVTAASAYPMGARVPWQPSQIDLLAKDWVVLEG